VIYSAGGNLLNQGADAQKSIAAFRKVDFSVCHEMFMTPSARFCDVVLPAASPLQKEDIGIPWAGNYLLYKPKILPYTGNERSDYDIFCDLAGRLGVGNAFSEGRSEAQWIEYFIAHSAITDPEEFRRSGIYLGEEQKRPGLHDFACEPGLFPLGTRSGKVELGGHHESFLEDERSREDVAAGRRILFISPKVAERVHSQAGEHPDQRGINRLGINPGTAEKFGFTDGQLVLVESRSGAMRIRLNFDISVMEDVVCAPEGTWLSGFGLLETGNIADSGSANLLTSTEGSKESVACIMHGIPVRVTPVKRTQVPPQVPPPAQADRRSYLPD